MAARFNKFHQIEDLLAIVGSWERFHLILGLSYSQAFPPSLILKNRYFCQQGESEKLGDLPDEVVPGHNQCSQCLSMENPWEYVPLNYNIYM